MDHRRPIIQSAADAEAMHTQILDGAARTADWLRSFGGEPLALLKSLRFELVGHDPLTGETNQPGAGTTWVGPHLVPERHQRWRPSSYTEVS